MTAGDGEDNQEMNEKADRPLFPVVGLGASAGGLEVYEQFFGRMPPDSGAAFVVVQHLAPDHASILAELLSKHTAMPVAQIQADMRVEPNRVYLIPPNHALTIDGGRLRLSPASAAPRLPIDGFFISLAQDCAERAIAIVLSGAGSDGAAGLAAIHERGGMIMAQLPESASFDSMPRSAIDTGLVDHVLRIDEIPARLVEHLRGLATDAPAARGLDEAKLIRTASEILQRRTGHNFSRYKESTLLRRITRRVDVVGAASTADYVAQLDRDPGEVDRLLGDILINVTQFFRDPDVFECLGREIVPRLFDNKTRGDSVRVWVPGCSSGEEAYSIAILLLEHLGSLDAAPEVRLFASDIDEDALATARSGVYSEAIVEHVSPERLERFFTRLQSGYQVKRSLRSMCFFTMHNLISHPPFSRLDLISCRNTLIYLKSDLQNELLTLLHYSLHPDGYLLLGPAESVAAHPELFRPVLEKQRIFHRLQPSVPPMLHIPLGDAPWTTKPAAPVAKEVRIHNEGVQRALLEKYVPASALVDDRGEILYLAGPMARYLTYRAGEPSNNLLELATRALRASLSAAFQEALSTRQHIVRPELRVETPDGMRAIEVSVRWMPELRGAAQVLLVVLEDRGPFHSAAQADELASDVAVEQLDKELRDVRALLQATLNDQQAASQRSQEVNEELLSMNEELRSTNEELQTSREELQSTNEELQTLTTELRRRIDELDAANNDLRNFFASTQIAALFLDPQMRIKRFTHAAKELFRLVESDVDRLISDIMPRFVQEDLMALVLKVLQTQEAEEHEIHRKDGDRWYAQRLQPYRTIDEDIAGVVMTFVDITDLKRAADVLVEADRRKDEFLAMLAHELRNPLAPIRNAVQVLRIAAHGRPVLERARQVIERQVGHMVRIIDDLLDVSRISQGKILLRTQRIDLVALVRSAVEDVRDTLAERSLVVEVDLPDSPLMVAGDATRLSQVVGNLLNNAGKFADPGARIGVTVSPRFDTMQAVLVVEDDGIGMDEGILARLFEPFSQADRSLARSRGGLGLGLSLVKGLVEAHGGSVRAESEGPGLGSRLTVVLPLDSAPFFPELEVPAAPSSSTPSPRSILVIEDNTDAAEMMQLVLELEGHRVALESDGSAAITTAKRSRPAVIFCDIGLAGTMDGYAVARAVRADPELRAIWLVAITGYGSDKDVASARAAGFDAHLTKPVAPEVLMDVVTNLHV